jgi:hypothetical protein
MRAAAARTTIVGAVLAAALGFGEAARAQPTMSVPLGGASGSAVLNALAQECYEAGLWSEMPSDSIMDCTAVLEERTAGAAVPEDAEPADVVVVRHKLRFTLLERRVGEGSVSADAWIETEELGTTIEQPITSDDYLRRAHAVMQQVVARLAGGGPPPWAGRYESEQAWHLDAHLNAVRLCDAGLARMTAESVAADLERVGLRPIGDDTRDRCEQLYTHIYEWGLARGNAAPTLDDYTRYRAALPPEQRTCSGQLAREASCRR